jgi:hypothetical protein
MPSVRLRGEGSGVRIRKLSKVIRREADRTSRASLRASRRVGFDTIEPLPDGISHMYSAYLRLLMTRLESDGVLDQAVAMQPALRVPGERTHASVNPQTR